MRMKVAFFPTPDTTAGWLCYEFNLLFAVTMSWIVVSLSESLET
jgi:hypothetical protein